MKMAIPPRSATTGLLYLGKLPEALEQGRKTKTMRSWPLSKFRTLQRAVSEGCVIPARTWYRVSDVFGVHVVSSIEEIRPDRLVEGDLKYEGVEEGMTVGRFLHESFKGVPKDTSRYKKKND